MTRRRGQGGFTLIELMIALVVSSLLVGMILAIFNRMSMSYRGQQQIAGVQQVLAAARATIETDAKQAGLGVSQGFKLGGELAGAAVHSPILWTDSSTGPDQVGFFYADPSLQAKVTAWNGPARQITIDANPGFAPGALIALVNETTPINGLGANDPTIARFDSCATKLSTATGTGTVLTLSTAGPWGRSSGSYCTITPGTTMVYLFVAHAYRIDTTTDTTITSGPMYPSARGTLQMTSTGGLPTATASGTDVWNDLAYGFTDLQVATRFYDNDTVDQDGDGDVTRDWYSGPAGANFANALSGADFVPPVRMSISLVARTDRDIEGISTAQTPNLVGTGAPTPPVDYNSIGNHPSVALPAQAPWSADPLLKGSRIYRYVTFQVDLRNMGVGR
ncbi:MAG TPA: prepilin-type N-terminal cleavage/methylation domain-containing protein [Kofleriaceae bacterium]